MSKNEKSEMMKKLFISGSLSLLVYVFSNNWGTALIVLGTNLRYFLFAKKEAYKTNLVFYICFFIHLIIGIITFTELIDILSISASLFGCFLTWFCNPQQVRKGFLLTDSLWVIFNLSKGLYIQSINSFIGVISKLFFIIKNRKK